MTVYVADMGSQNPVDFVKLGKSGCVGVILRATRSNQQDDTLYPQRHALARTNNLLCAAYAFNTGEAPAIQVSRFLTEAKIASDEAGYLDLEMNPSGGQMNIAMTCEWVDRYAQAIGRCCGLYSGNVIKTLMAGNRRLGIPPATEAQRDFLAKTAVFWGCEYGPRFRNVDDNGRTLPWPKPFLWQYTGDGIGPQPHTFDGLESGADLSVFDGTADELRAQWALPAIPAAPVAA